MNFVSLFSGIGGLDLGLERAGMRCVAQVEIDPFCRKVLAKHWPDVRRFADVKDVTRESLSGLDFTWIVGGFPCQPVSIAGKKKAQDDARWLWPEFHRLICEIHPDGALLENVTGLLGRGIGEVLGDLAACGYDAEWDCLPAAAFGAPHLRDRVFVVAYPQSQRWGAWRPGRSDPSDSRQSERPFSDGLHPDADGFTGERGGNLAEREAEGGVVVGRHSPAPADTTGAGLQWQVPAGRIWGRGVFAQRDRWSAEPDVARMGHGIPDRVERTRAIGNAVVPQVAEFIGRRIMEAEGRAVA